MAKKPTFAGQFRGGYYPQEPVDPGSPLNSRYSPPPASRKNNGITPGSSTEAYPGMVGKNDYSRKRKK